MIASTLTIRWVANDEPDDDQLLQLQDLLCCMPQPAPQDVPQVMWPNKVGHMNEVASLRGSFNPSSSQTTTGDVDSVRHALPGDRYMTGKVGPGKLCTYTPWNCPIASLNFRTPPSSCFGYCYG